MNSFITKNYKHLVWIPLFAGLYYAAQYQYLLFHSLIEIFSVIVACGIFVVAWNSRKLIESHYLLFLGIAYLFIAMIDLLHPLGYSGMNIFPGYDANLPTQLWIFARYMESISLLMALLFIKRRINVPLVLSAYALVFTISIISIFWMEIFPVCYVEGTGLTLFKKTSEYIISLTILFVIVLLFLYREEFEKNVWKLLIASMVMTIFSELAFTFYISVYGFSNMVGHFFKLLSFYMIYKAVIETGLTRPYDLLYRNLKLSEESYRNIYDTAPLAFVVWDRECRITGWNRCAEDMFGWKKDEVIGKNFFDVILPESERSHVRSIVDRLLQSEISNQSINENITKKGDIILCEWNNVIRHDSKGEIEGVLSLGLDITERRKAEEALIASSEKIKLFAYSVSHDLKNPSIVLNILAKNLTNKYGDILDVDGKGYCNNIIEISEQVIALVDNINIYINTKENPQNIELINLKDICTMINVEFSDRLNTRGIKLSETENMPEITADRISIVRVLRNFIDNALKYGGDGLSKIQIGYRDTDDHHILSVTDNGVGLAKKDIENVFGLFKRNITSKGVPGSGLGLAIVKEIAEKFQGMVWAEPGENKGVTFFMSISKML